MPEPGDNHMTHDEKIAAVATAEQAFTNALGIIEPEKLQVLSMVETLTGEERETTRLISRKEYLKLVSAEADRIRSMTNDVTIAARDAYRNAKTIAETIALMASQARSWRHAAEEFAEALGVRPVTTAAPQTAPSAAQPTQPAAAPPTPQPTELPAAPPAPQRPHDEKLADAYRLQLDAGVGQGNAETAKLLALDLANKMTSQEMNELKTADNNKYSNQMKGAALQGHGFRTQFQNAIETLSQAARDAQDLATELSQQATTK